MLVPACIEVRVGFCGGEMLPIPSMHMCILEGYAQNHMSLSMYRYVDECGFISCMLPAVLSFHLGGPHCITFD